MFPGGASEQVVEAIGAPLAALAISQPSLLSLILICGGGLVLLAPMARRWFLRLRGAEAAPPSVQHRAEGATRMARDRETLEALMKDVRELTRLCTQQLDSRAERLEGLLAQADERIAALQRASGDGRCEPPLIETRASGSRRARQSPGAVSMLEESRSGPVSDPVARQIYELADQGQSPVQIAGALEEHVGKVELILALRSL